MPEDRAPYGLIRDVHGSGMLPQAYTVQRSRTITYSAIYELSPVLGSGIYLSAALDFDAAGEISAFRIRLNSPITWMRSRCSETFHNLRPRKHLKLWTSNWPGVLYEYSYTRVESAALRPIPIAATSAQPCVLGLPSFVVLYSQRMIRLHFGPIGAKRKKGFVSVLVRL